MTKVIFKLKKKMSPECMQNIAEGLREAYRSGIVIVDDNIDVYVIEDPEVMEVNENEN